VEKASAKTISRRPAPSAGKAQRGRKLYLFSRKNREKIEEKLRGKMQGPSWSHLTIRYEKVEKSQKTPVSPLLPGFCGELLWNEDFAATPTP
jgi:hypothetical protein